MQIGGITRDLHRSRATLRRNMKARSAKDSIYTVMGLTRGLVSFIARQLLF